MRRSLALTDETARHPFLAGLPPHVRHAVPDEEEEGEGAKPGLQAVIGRLWRVSSGDVRDFLMAYCACFMAASLFIA